MSENILKITCLLLLLNAANSGNVMAHDVTLPDESCTWDGNLSTASTLCLTQTPGEVYFKSNSRQDGQCIQRDDVRTGNKCSLKTETLTAIVSYYASSDCSGTPTSNVTMGTQTYKEADITTCPGIHPAHWSD